MLKQALKASLKVEVSLSILKEAKNTFPALSQWRCKRLMNTSSKSKWDLYSAVCLERHPLITRPMNELEKKFYDLLKTMEYEKSLKSDHELRIEKEKREAASSSESDDFDINTAVLQTAEEFEEFNQDELNNFKFGPRITEFDLSGDKTSNMRKLDKTLVLLIEQKINDQVFWLPPQGLRNDGETMRQAAERVLQEFCGTKMTVKFYGNAPIGFYKYKYVKKNEKTGKDGAKVFYFLARYKNGSIENNLKRLWLDKEEIKDTVPPVFYNNLEKFLISG